MDNPSRDPRLSAAVAGSQGSNNDYGPGSHNFLGEHSASGTQHIHQAQERMQYAGQDAYQPQLAMYPPQNEQSYVGQAAAFQNGPQGYISPSHSSPQSAGQPISPHLNEAGPAQENEGNDIKRPRACEACRGLKVRCDINPSNPEGACKRCAKAGRACVITAPIRKRQKKTDSRVAELEKKIDALTQTLHGKGPGNAESTDGESSSATTSRQGSYSQPTTADDRPSRAEPERRLGAWEPSPEKETAAAAAAIQKRKSVSNTFIVPVLDSVKVTPGSMNWMAYEGRHDQMPAKRENGYKDVIDRGIISVEIANEVFERYVGKMALHLPFVVLPRGITAAELRKSRPILFLSILASATGKNYHELQRILTKEVMAVYGDRILSRGEKSLELVQALLVSTIWYFTPDHFEELKFYTLIHLAAVMAIDISLSKRAKTFNFPAGELRDLTRRNPFPASGTVEARRAWLGCYFMCCNSSMGLRRPNLIRWNTYMEECIEVFETSSDAAPGDIYLSQWVRCQHLAEQIGIQFSMDDPFATVVISDPKVQYAMKGFEMDLQKWKDRVPENCRTPLLKMTENYINLYMHEVSMHVDHNVEEFKPPFTEASLRSGEDKRNLPMSAVHIGALSSCLTSIEGMFDAFLSLEIDEIRSMPVLHFVRIAYATVVLMKMFFASAQDDSELGKVISKDDMRVKHYLDLLLEKFRRAASEEKCRPAGKFLMVLTMMKTWFDRQVAPKLSPEEEAALQGEGVPGSNSETPRQKKAKQVEVQKTNTRLEMLSEVATSQPPRQTPPSAPMPTWQPAPNTYNYNDPHSINPMSYSMPQMAPAGYANIDPNVGVGVPLEMDFGVGVGAGMETAMGMTLGDADGMFGKYFSDDTYFGMGMPQAYGQSQGHGQGHGQR